MFPGQGSKLSFIEESVQFFGFTINMHALNLTNLSKRDKEKLQLALLQSGVLFWRKLGKPPAGLQDRLPDPQEDFGLTAQNQSC